MQFKATVLILLGTALTALASPVAAPENAAANPLFEVQDLHLMVSKNSSKGGLLEAESAGCSRGKQYARDLAEDCWVFD
ncbi:hypothetical protein PSPO01_08609 [Paraphaeosphaeria sporulosa]